MINLVTIGSKIRRIRTAGGLSQAALAKRAGVSRATINAIENGSVKEIGVNRLMEIVRAADAILPVLKASDLKTGARKSETLGLSLPYDWSNSGIRDEVLIDRVIERGIFEDIVRVSAAYGVTHVAGRIKVFAGKNPAAAKSLNRMLGSIERAAKIA